MACRRINMSYPQPCWRAEAPRSSDEMKCGVWRVKCEVWGVKSAVWSVKCGVWRKQWEVRSVKCGLWSVKCGVWSVDWGECSVNWEVWSVDCEGRGVKREDCQVWSVTWGFKCDMWNTTSVSQSARTHGLGWRTAHASSIDEKGLIYIFKATSAPPRAGTTGNLILHYIILFIICIIVFIIFLIVFTIFSIIFFIIIFFTILIFLITIINSSSRRSSSINISISSTSFILIEHFHEHVAWDTAFNQSYILWCVSNLHLDAGNGGLTPYTFAQVKRSGFAAASFYLYPLYPLVLFSFCSLPFGLSLRFLISVLCALKLGRGILHGCTFTSCGHHSPDYMSSLL